MTGKLRPDRRAAWSALALTLLVGAVEWAMHRPPICPCGRVRLWWGLVQSPENSQQIADWYSLTHIVHGLLFYAAGIGLLRLLHFPARWGLALAVAVEGGWEILENSPIIIERYRAVTISWGYSGDSIVNSLSDIGFMALGFLWAGRMPVRASIALGLALELLNLVLIRDNLALNLLMLNWPVEAVRQWQQAVI